MTILIVIGISTLIQAGLYWLCIYRKLNYIDFGILALGILCNLKLLPMWILPPFEEGACGFSERGFGLMAFMFIGNAATVVTFIIYVIIRKRL